MTYIHSMIVENDDRDKYVKMFGIWQFWMELKVWNFFNHVSNMHGVI